VLITAEAVQNGKPDPTCYLLGKEKLGLELDQEVLVIEDTPAGIKAGNKTGYKVLALATTHTVSELWNARADWVVKDLEIVTATVGKLRDGKRGVVVEVLELLGSRSGQGHNYKILLPNYTAYKSCIRDLAT
jgi:glycerol 3-phosphatase-1